MPISDPIGDYCPGFLETLVLANPLLAAFFAALPVCVIVCRRIKQKSAKIILMIMLFILLLLHIGVTYTSQPFPGEYWLWKPIFCL